MRFRTTTDDCVVVVVALALEMALAVAHSAALSPSLPHLHGQKRCRKHQRCLVPLCEAQHPQRYSASLNGRDPRRWESTRTGAEGETDKGSAKSRSIHWQVLAGSMGSEWRWRRVEKRRIIGAKVVGQSFGNSPLPKMGMGQIGKTIDRLSCENTKKGPTLLHNYYLPFAASCVLIDINP
ncbi:hypothetical protein BJV77DRAFT_1124397 [Russula vinacea]|nr:hypothetical protein BJV77DRAFT_1124397 [Russula vinacea]